MGNQFLLKVRHLFKLLFITLFSSMVSMHGKRVLFIASVNIQLIKSQKQPTREMLHRLNDALHLANVDTNSLLFPTKYYYLFWDEKKLREALFECGFDMNCHVSDIGEIEKLSQRILDITPNWMRYGRKEDMINDLKRLLWFQSMEEATL